MLKAKRARLLEDLRKYTDPGTQWLIKLKIDEIEEELWKATKTKY